jgi:hypothetical protein
MHLCSERLSNIAFERDAANSAAPLNLDVRRGGRLGLPYAAASSYHVLARLPLERCPMPLIHVAIQEGFQNDTLVVHLDGVEVYRRAALKTRMQIGLADSFDLDAAPGPAELRVEVLTRNASVTIPLKVVAGRELHVGVSVTPDGAVTYKATDEPFRYA